MTTVTYDGGGPTAQTTVFPLPARTTLQALNRHVRLYRHFARTCLLREMMFRANFVTRLMTHVLWLGLMLAFLKVLFLHTRRLGDWDEPRLLFFVGTYLTINATVNCFFMTGCGRLSELVRTGNLDFELLKPVDEQFLLTCQRIDWALFPQILVNKKGKQKGVRSH